MRAIHLAVAIAAGLLPAAALAQDYPSRPVLFVNPYASGGGTETMARLLGRKLEQRLGKPFVIESRPGAGTSIGATLNTADTIKQIARTSGDAPRRRTQADPSGSRGCSLLAARSSIIYARSRHGA